MSHSISPIAALLQEGIAAAHGGEVAQARACLVPVVQADKGNVQAWYWLSRVVETEEEREICLENVLALDPDHSAVRTELLALRARTSHARDVSDLSPTAIPTTPEEQWISDAAVEPLACPYCGAESAPLGRICMACGRPLWVRQHKTRGHSIYSMGLVLAWILQANYVWLGLCLAYVGAGLVQAMNAAPGAAVALNTLLDLVGSEEVDFTAVALPLLPALLAGGAAFAFSLVVAVGLYVRSPFFYWLAVGLILVGFLALFYRVFAAEHLSLVALACNLLLLMATMSFAFMAYDEFAWIDKRVAADLDPDVDSDSALYMRGRDHAAAGMWARAAVHWAKAVALQPGHPDYRLALASAYIRLGESHRALEHLNEVRRIEPDNPQLPVLLARIEGVSQGIRSTNVRT